MSVCGESVSFMARSSPTWAYIHLLSKWNIDTVASSEIAIRIPLTNHYFSID
jgi:hypothetical protein